MSDWSIPLAARTAQIDSPLEAQARGLSLQQMTQGLKNSQQQQELNRLRIEDEKAKAEKLAEDRKDEEEIQRAWLEHGGDYDKIRASVAPKVRLRNVQRFDEDHLKHQQAATSASNEQRVATKLSNDLIGGEIAGLLQLPYEQRKTELPAVLERLKKNKIDVARYEGFDPNDDNLKSAAASVNYLGTLLSNAEKKALEEKRIADAKRAKEQGEAADAKEKAALRQQKIEDATRLHLGVTSQEEHDKWLKTLDAEVAPLFQNLKNYDKATQTAVQRIALSAQQRQADVAREQAGEDRADYQRESLDLRRDIADQSAALRRELAANQPGRGNKLTHGQLKTEERNISALEDGTASRPGLNALRLKIGTMLKTSKNETGEDLDEAGRTRLESQLEGVNTNLQNVQYRKAKLYNVSQPDPADVDAAADKEEIEAQDGSIWTKKNGVAFFTRMGGGAAPAGAPATQPAVTPSPSAQPSAPAKQQAAGQAPTTKTFPRAKLDAFAKANSMTAAEAEKQLKAQGYSIQ